MNTIMRSMVLIIAALALVNAASIYDLHVTGVTAGASGSTFASYARYYWNTTDFPNLATETVAVKLVLIAGGLTSGDSCFTAKEFYTALGCGLGAAAVSVCNRTSYSVIDGTTQWCLIIVGSGAAATINIDVEWTTASYASQWHLTNTGQFGGVSGNDVNATGAWAQNAYGENVVIMIVDTGVQKTHAEVTDKFVSSLSWNPETSSRDPTPSIVDDDHGTGCAGVAAAAINNYCGQGAAPKASIAGFRIFGDTYQSAVSDFSRGMYYNEAATDGTSRRVAISSNSWGPQGCSSSGCYFAPITSTIATAIITGAESGRNGLGVVYVFAAGNEGYYSGDSNMYHYCKLPEVMCIAGSDFMGRRVYYSNAGANLFVNSPTQAQSDATAGLFPGIITAQLSVTGSTSNCKGNFGGTSSSTPLVAGIIAQILGVRPDLTYRDVQHIIQKTADRNDPLSLQWLQNGAGVWFSHHSGFGRINAGNAVALAGNWTKLGGSCGISTSIKTVGTTIPDNSPLTPVTSTFTLVAGTASLPDTLESVTVYVSIAHAYPHDLRIKLTSPQGTTAILARPAATRYSNTLTTLYPLAARIFWGESPVGIWTIAITDEIAADTGVFNNWALEVQGAGNGTIPDRLYGAAPASRSMTMVITLGAMISAIVALFA